MTALEKATPQSREKFHKLIDSVIYSRRLEAYYLLIREIDKNEEGELWKSMSDEDRQRILDAYEESFDDSKLIDHMAVLEGLEIWLKRKSTGKKTQAGSLTK